MSMTPTIEQPLTTIGRVGKPVVEFVGTEDIPIHPVEQLHLVDYDDVLSKIKAGRVAVFNVPSDEWFDFKDWLCSLMNADLEMGRDYLEVRYVESTGKLYAWSSDHSPWPFLTPAEIPSDLPTHPRDVVIILAREHGPV